MNEQVGTSQKEDISYNHIEIPEDIQEEIIEKALLNFRKEKFFDIRRQQLLSNLSENDILKASDRFYSNIDVSTHEKEIIVSKALFDFRKKEHHRIETKKYWDKVNNPVQFLKLNFEQTFNLFKKRVLAIEPNFSFSKQNEYVIRALCLYFSNDDRFETELNFSLKKGIMLSGSVGCGKTTIMKAFMINSQNSFSFAKCRDVSNEFMLKDNQDNTVSKYSKIISDKSHVFVGQKDVGLCFDDLGTESVKKNYGNDTDVMSEIIYLRYERKLFNKTHFTLNINGDNIKEMYGHRLYSRLREMCNHITFCESIDYRCL